MAGQYNEDNSGMPWLKYRQMGIWRAQECDGAKGGHVKQGQQNQHVAAGCSKWHSQCNIDLIDVQGIE